MSMMPIDEEQGLLGGMMMDPRSMGLLNLGAGLLQASGPSRMPIGLGQAIGMALPQGIQGMQTAYAMKQQDEMNKLRRQQMQFELEALRRRQQEQEAERNSVMGFLDAQNPTTTMHRAPSPLPDAQNDNPMVPVTGVDPARLATARKDLIANSPSVRNAFVSGLFKEEQPYNLRPGERRMVGDRMIAENPASDKESEFVRNLKAAGIMPGTPLYSQLMSAYLQKQATHAPAASATVINRQEGAEAAAVGKSFGEQFADIQKAGLNAGSSLNKYLQLEQLLSGVETGKLTPAGTDLAAWGQSIGLQVDPKLGNKQAADAIVKALALEMRNPAGGAGMPGALSDKDREFLMQTVPSLANTPEGNKQIIEAKKKLLKRDQEVANLARKYRQKNGTLNEGFFDELEKFANDNPLFGAALKKIKSDAEYNALPSGTEFIDPDGKRRRKP